MNQHTKLLVVCWFAALLFIPTLSVFGRNLQYLVEDTIGYVAAAWIIGFSLFFLISGYLLWLFRHARPVPWLHLLWFAPLFLLLPLLLDRVEERLHFLTFGLFGALTLVLFRPRIALVICIIVSAADELLQYYLPDRVGDWFDVAMNALASVSAAIFIWLTIRRPDSMKNV